MTEIERRVAAIAATRARFEGRAFAWGRVDCAKVAAFHLRQMGHRRSLGLARAGSYSSALGARRALRRAGHDSLERALERAGAVPIAAAAALPADMLITPGTDGIDALAIMLGNMAVLGFHEDAMARGVTIIRINTLADFRAVRL